MKNFKKMMAFGVMMGGLMANSTFAGIMMSDSANPVRCNQNQERGISSRDAKGIIMSDAAGIMMSDAAGIIMSDVTGIMMSDNAELDGCPAGGIIVSD